MHPATEDQATLPGRRCVTPGGWEQGVWGGASSCLYYPLGFPQDGLGIWLFWRLKIIFLYFTYLCSFVFRCYGHP